MLLRGWAETRIDTLLAAAVTANIGGTSSARWVCFVGDLYHTHGATRRPSLPSTRPDGRKKDTPQPEDGQKNVSPMQTVRWVRALRAPCDRQRATQPSAGLSKTWPARLAAQLKINFTPSPRATRRNGRLASQQGEAA